MKQSQDQIQTLQVLYELAMSIGTSLDLHQMLKGSLQSFVEKLNCVEGGVYQYQTVGDALHFEAIHTIPQDTDRNDISQAALANLPVASNAQEMGQFLESLPLVNESEDGNYYHVLELPGFGVMVLVKNKAAIDPFWVESLRPLQEKLAAAAIACLSETALRKAQEHSQVILGSVTTPLLISRVSDGKIIYANQLLADMIHSPLEALIGEVTPDFYADASDRQTLLRNLREQGSLSNYELHLKRSDGELIWVLISIRLFEYQGEPALITTFFDITERKQTMQALEEAQSRNQLILESVTLPLLISRVEDGTVVFANERVIEMMDMQLEDVIGKQTPNFYYNPDDRLEVLNGVREHGGIDNKELPIVRNGEILWVLLSNRLVQYEGDAAIVTTLVDITDRKNTEEALAKRASELETVAQVSASASTILETDKLLQEVVDLTKERFNLYHAHIYLFNEVNDNLVLTAGAGDVGRQMVAEKRTIPLAKEQSLVAQAARTKLGVIENNVLNNPSFLPHPLLPETKAEMAVPMLVGERVVGVLDIQASEANYFTQQDVTVNTTLAAQIGIALENTASFEQAQTSLAETLALLDITKETSRTLELENMLDNVLDQVLTATGFAIGLISIEKPGTRELELKSYRLPDEFLHLIQENGLGGTLCDLVYQRAEPIIVLDLDDNAPVNTTALVNMGYQSYQGVPLEAQGRVFGTICIFNDELLASEQVNKRFLQAVGQQVGIAIQNATLFEQTQKAVSDAEQSRQDVQEYLDLQRVLHEINRELFLINDVDELYRRAVELAHTHLGFERIGMYLLNETKDELSGTYGINVEGKLENEQDDEHNITASETIDSFVLNRSRLVIEEETDLWDVGSVLGRGWHIGAAMWVEESPIGVMFADNLITGKPLKSYQAELLFAYAGIVANLIERNRIDAIIAKRAAEMQAVAEVGTAVSQVRETDELLQAVVDLTKIRFDLYHSHIYLLDADQDALVMAVGAGEVGRELVAQGHQINLNAAQSLVAQAARTREAVVVNDVRNDPHWLPNALLPDTQSEMAVPLVVGGQVLGVLDVQSNEVDHFTEQDIQIQMTLAAQTAVALQNARSYEQVQDALMAAQRSQETLQERETLMRTIIDSTPDWIFVKDREHRYQIVNQGYANSFNMPPEDFIGKNDLDLGFPEDIVKGNPEKGIQGFWPDDNEVMASGEMKVVDVEPGEVGGEPVYLSTIKTPLRDAKGNIAGVVGFVHDITNRITVEEALRRSEGELSQAMEVAKLAYWEYDAEKDVFSFNDQFYSLFHTTAEQHGGYQLQSAYYAQHFVYPDDLPIVGAEIERGLNSTERHFSRSVEHRILYADGGVGYISVDINIIRDEHGKILRYYGVNQDITERKRAEEALRRSEGELSQAMEVAKLAYWEFDYANDRFIFNDQFYALFRTTAEQHGGYRLSSEYYAQHFVHQDDLAMVGGEIERAVNSTDQYYNRSLEHRILYADGEVGYMSVSINIERDKDGNIVRYYGANQDITERKRSEEVLRESEASLSEALKVAKLAYWEFDVENDLFIFNDQFFSLFHTTAEAHGGYQLASNYYAEHFVYPEDLSMVSSEIERALTSTGRKFTTTFEHRILYADGGVGYISVNTNVDRDEQGKIVRFAGANQDITERKRVEESLRERETLMRTIVDSTPDWIFVKDLEHRYQMVNKGYADSFNMLPEDFVGKNDLDIGFPEDVVKGNPEKGIQGFWPDDNEVMARGKMKVVDVEPAEVGGEQVYLSTIKTPLKDVNDNVTGVVGFVHDITNRIRAEEAATQQAQRLAKLNEMSAAFNQADSLDDIYHFVGLYTQAVLGGDRASLALVDPHGKTFAVSGLSGEKGVIPLDTHLPIEGTAVGEVIVTGKMKQFPQDGAMDKYMDTSNMAKAGMQSTLSAPIMIDGKVIGTINVADKLPDAFGRPEVSLMQQVANLVSSTLQIRQYLEVAEKQAQELQTVADISTAVSTTLEQEKLLQDVVDLTKERFGLYHGHIYLLNSSRDALVMAVGAGDVGRELVAQKHQINVNAPQSLVAQAARAREAVVVNDVRNDPNWLPNELLPNTQAEMAVPMMVGGQVIGVLDVQSDEVNYFNDQDIQIQTTLAAQTAVALQNARSYQQAQTAVAEMNELTRRLTREGWQGYLQQQATEKTGFMFDASELDAIQPVADGSELVLDENGSMPPHVQPISIRGEEIGRLVVFPDDTGEAIDAEMLEILNVITEQLGARIDNIRLADQTQTALAETETQAQRLGQLNQMSNVLSQASSLENVYAAAVAETPNVLDADHVSLTLLTDSREKFDVAAGWGEEAQMSVNVPIPISDELPMWVAVQERRIVPGRIDDVIQSALFVPLYASGQVIGTLNIGSKRQHGFDSRDENLLRQIAALVSSTIENLRFLEKEQSRAQREQVLRQITQRVRSSADVETIMRTAVQEIGRTLGRKTYIYLGEDEA